jgi:2,3-bisphosphoglycerate-independent phosphoglycerate mutase
VVEALGIDWDLKPDEIAARGNFCTADDNGVIVDRRAGRISTDMNTELCRLLDDIAVDGAEIQVRPVKEHRFVLILRGDDLFPELTDSDPQQAGLPPRTIEALSPRQSELQRLLTSSCHRPAADCGMSQRPTCCCYAGSPAGP